MLEMTQVGGFVQTDANVDQVVAKFLPNQKQSVSPAVPAVASTAALGGGLGAMSRGLRNEGKARRSASLFSGEVSSTGSALGRERKNFANFKAHPPKNPDFARNSADVYARRLGSLNTAHTQAKTGLHGANQAVKAAGRMRTAGKVGVAAGAVGLAGSGAFAMRRNGVGKSFPDSPDAHVKGVLKPMKKLSPTSTPVGKTSRDQQLKQGRNMVGVGVGTAASAQLLGHSPARSFKALGSSYQAGAHLQRAMGSARHTALGAGLRTAGSAARSSRVRGGLLTAGAIGGGAGLAAAGFHQITQASKQGANRKRVR